MHPIHDCHMNGILHRTRHYLPLGKNVQEASRSTRRTRESFKPWVAADSPEKKYPAEAAHFHGVILSVCKQGRASPSCANISSQITHTDCCPEPLRTPALPRNFIRSVLSVPLVYLSSQKFFRPGKGKWKSQDFPCCLGCAGIQLLLDSGVTEVLFASESHSF